MRDVFYVIALGAALGLAFSEVATAKPRLINFAVLVLIIGLIIRA